MKWIALVISVAACSSTSKVEGDASSSCTEADLTACDYPEKKLTFTEREGINVQDARTGRTLPLLARVPQGAGPLPVVVWSHGGGFNAGGHKLGKEWGTALAAQGYAVIHIGHVPLTQEAGTKICAEVAPAECTGLGSDDEDGPLVGMVKGFDILGVLDKLKTLSDESVARGGPALDLTRIVAAGWSAGARGPMMLMGTKMKLGGSNPVFSRPDTRVVAAIGLSTAGPGFGGYYETSWEAMRGPYFMATGTNDVKPLKPELTGTIRRFPFTAQPGDGQRYLLYSNLPVGVGGHPTYNLEDATSSDERLSRLSRALRSSVLAFLDAYVNKDEAAKAWLATQNAKVLAGDVDWQKR